MLCVTFWELQQKDILSYYKKIYKIFPSFFGLCGDYTYYILEFISNVWILDYFRII